VALTPAELRAIAREHWADARQLSDAVLYRLLGVASGDVAAFAPAPLLASTLPADVDRVALATTYQARELYAAATRTGDVVGIGDFPIRSRPLLDSIKALLRPRRGMPGIG
jgi:hypothetical protein